MTTTAHEDQFTAMPAVAIITIKDDPLPAIIRPEPVREPLSREAILRRNIADMEKELQRQSTTASHWRQQYALIYDEMQGTPCAEIRWQHERAELVARAESYAETLRSLASYVGAGGYNADAVDAGVFEEKVRWGIDGIMTRAEAAEAELAKARGQAHVSVVTRMYSDNISMALLVADEAPIGTKLYAAPVPATAVPYGVDEEAANRIALAVYDCKNDICPEPLLYAINRILAAEAHPLSVEGRDALLQSAPQAPAVPEDQFRDATKLVVPDDWRNVMKELADDAEQSLLIQYSDKERYPSLMLKFNNDMELVDRARALLQSAEVTK